MIEGLDALPSLFIVAVVAFFAEASVVSICLSVATDTVTWGFAKLRLGRMASGTWDYLVCTIDHKIRECMIESIPIELHNIGTPPLVIRMTALAFAAFGRGLTAMKAALLLTISGHILVAGKAQAALGRFREGFMATGAILLQVGVLIDQRSGHHHPFEHGLGIGWRPMSNQQDRADDDREK